jgi:hypothetical protein
MNRSWPLHLPAVLALSMLAAACNDASTERRAAIAERLVGTWLEEAEGDGMKIRRVLTLEKDGTFRQAAKSLESDGSSRSEGAAGEWFFDGQTFKRRYHTVNGRRVSGIQFASYEFSSLTDTELACVDHLTEGRRKILFRRVPDGTVP